MMESAYDGVHLWAKAVEAGGSTTPNAVRQKIRGMEYDAPQGRVAIDSDTQMTVQTPRVACIDKTGQLELVYIEPRPVKPIPFPPPYTRSEWDAFLKKLYDGWGGRWSNPGP
jgi:urea transport system substrate-binding protein